MTTPYHAAYYAYEITRRSPSDSIAKLGPSLFNATIDLNPHQIDAALFAFRSPLSRGAILADEVGLGKTIEAGLIISQLWAEHNRRILIIAPTILRKQWAQELADKFYIPSQVIDSREYNARRKAGYACPLTPQDCVIICSYHFARTKAEEIAETKWDLVVIDEAHRLRNVYKSGNKIASGIKEAVQGRPMLLLTATPLQNNLLELFGLVSFLDEHIFGHIDTFRSRYMRGPIEQRQLNELRQRLHSICQRTLRRQVIEYVRFTNRIPITQDFTPTVEEQELYDRVSTYLQRENLNALPSAQRKLMTLVLRKLLASSSFAIAGTFEALAARLKKKQSEMSEALENDFESFEEMEEEWSEGTDTENGNGRNAVSEADILAEIQELTSYGSLAASITTNAKGQALLSALEQGFQKLEELGAPRKAVIFTESRRTQSYLLRLLNNNGYEGRVLTINGTNTDGRAGHIYKDWVHMHAGESIVSGNKAVDLRAALVEYFRDFADIMIATEAAAEGINLQFCSLVVNYDLPWNPQRIEQRIGRCHRYGQAHDVVVINFLNRANAADQRVFELLSEKFRLFGGVFGSSDEVLGALESGVDFERRIADIYQNCRTAKDINVAFAKLQSDLEEQIAARMAETRTAILENFDVEVHQRLRMNSEQSQSYLNRLEHCLWNLTKYELRQLATFDNEAREFHLHNIDSKWPPVPLGLYRLLTRVRQPGKCHAYRLNHPLAETAVKRAKERALQCAAVTFNYSDYQGKIGLVSRLAGNTGWMTLARLKVLSLAEEDHLLFAGLYSGGKYMHPEVCEKLFQLDGQINMFREVPAEIDESLHHRLHQLRQETIAVVQERNSQYFDQEIEKLERWAEDLKYSLEAELKLLDTEIKQARREAKLTMDLENKLARHRTVKDLEARRSKKRRELFEAQDGIDVRKEDLIDDVESRLRQETTMDDIFTIQWRVE
jgi:SNF2 family DNA or RNA helicase